MWQFHVYSRTITFKDMYYVNSKLDVTQATKKVLKIANPVLHKLLTNLFNKCITTNVFPSQMKCANITYYKYFLRQSFD